MEVIKQVAEGTHQIQECRRLVPGVVAAGTVRDNMIVEMRLGFLVVRLSEC